MYSELHIAEFSDVHLAHPKTPTVEILNNLRRAFPDTEETGKIDLLFIAGDLFDGLMTLEDPDVVEIKLWIHQLLRMCKRRDIVVRVLEGTPSHDWKQSKTLFNPINENALIGADIKYVETLSIEYIERFGINVLYVPDEWTPDPNDTWLQTLQLLKSHGLEQVDYAVMHGNFTYQLPAVAKIPSHVPERYLSIVKKYIFIGHVHRSSRYERILASGSFDRLSHGEEDPKGHWRVTVRDNGNDDVVFVENKGAKTYRTIDCTGLTIEEALKRCEIAHELKDGSHIRVAAAKTDPILTSLNVLRSDYPTMHWTSTVTETSTVLANRLVDLRSTFTQLNITRDNIEELVMERLRKLTNDERIINRCLQRLPEIVQ
jgi:DNA repair exonuclease SbcCD nuclease subunit